MSRWSSKPARFRTTDRASEVAKTLLTPAPAVQLLLAPVVEMSPGGSYVVAVDTAAV